ncbi:MAG: D-2-hydroxyacid dehydrogenase [Proteobacteria bacterium]|jgi:glycerate dehydrogenase|nr:D-2-hydroxyacid dehydrogenase [Pseudomonadota bacterium]
MMKGVILDAMSLGPDPDLTPVTGLLDDWRIFMATNRDQLTDHLLDADIVLTNKVQLPRGVLQNHQKIKLISLMATGTNNVDLTAATDFNIVVSNAVGYATPSVSQHTFALLLNLVTQQPNYLLDTQQGRWQQSPVFCRLDHPITELSGKTMGIIGWGTLGQAVGALAQAFGMNVIAAHSQGSTGDQKTAAAVDRHPLEKLLKLSDVVSLHCPLTANNHHLINSETLSLMKPGAFFINTARGGLVDSTALLSALDSGQIAGAAIDVLTEEPPRYDDPLFTEPRPNLLITPHNAWGAIEARQRLIQQMAENIERFCQGSPVRVVNA